MSELEQFLENLPSEKEEQADVFEPETPKADVPAKDEELEEVPESVKNRRHRRLEAQLQKERDARIAAEARASALAESRLQTLPETDVPADWLAMYGDTPEVRKSYAVIKEPIVAQVRQEVIEEIQRQQQEAAQEQAQFEEFIDSQLEAIEDAHGVDLTSNAPAAKKARREYLEMVQKFSPKSEDGTIREYADFDTVWENYQASSKKPSNTEAKRLASRSMNQTSSGNQLQNPDDEVRNWARTAGI